MRSTPARGPRRHQPPHRIAVFRALQLGDMLCAIPALRALRRWAPDARITLIGLPWAWQFVERFPSYIDDFLMFPGAPGFPEQPEDAADLPRFLATVRSRRFDLAIQLHGSGEHSNGIVSRFGARTLCGFHPPGDVPPRGRFLRWPAKGPEIERCLQLIKHLGAAAPDTTLEFPLFEEDWAAARRLIENHGLPRGEYICVHPGARLPSRRWPLDRFARVAAALAENGWPVVITGSAAETALAENLLQQFPGAVDLSGKTSLGALAAVIAQSRLLICNDTGVSHVAAAVGTPSVVIACGSDVLRWAPLDRSVHRVLSHHPPCRPCSFFECPIEHVCAQGVAEQNVIRESLGMLHRTASGHAA